MWLWAAVSTSVLAELNVNIQQVLLNLHDTEKFVQKQEDTNGKMKEALRDSNGEIKAMTLEEMGIRKEEDGVRKELEKERNKYGQLQNASLKLASEYKTLLNNRNELQKENAKLRTEKELVISALSKIKTEMNPFVAGTASSPFNSESGAQVVDSSTPVEHKDGSEESVGASAGLVSAAESSSEKKEEQETTIMHKTKTENTASSKNKKKEKEQKKELKRKDKKKAGGKTQKKKPTVSKTAEESANVEFPFPEETLDASISGDDEELNALTVENPETWNSDNDGDDQVISLVQEAGFMKSS